MIGIFDSGHGGLTVLKALIARFPDEAFVYLGDHRSAPYGDRTSDEVVNLTRTAVEALFKLGCRLVILGCNTATCVAARTLQRVWLPGTVHAGRCNVLGIVAPTVEAATQTPWAVTTPQYPQKYNTDLVAVFGTTRTITSDAYPEEIRKRCPRVTVVQQICADLAAAIEAGAGAEALDRLVQTGVDGLLAQTGGRPPDRAILGCTHYPLVEGSFRRHLPAFTRLLSQPEIVADSLEDYRTRHPEYRSERPACSALIPLASGERLDHVRDAAVAALVDALDDVAVPAVPCDAVAQRGAGVEPHGGDADLAGSRLRGGEHPAAEPGGLPCGIGGDTPDQQVVRPTLEDQHAIEPAVRLSEPDLHGGEDAGVVGQQRQRLAAEQGTVLRVGRALHGDDAVEVRRTAAPHDARIRDESGGRRRHNAKPPSTRKVWPVVKAASSEAR